MNDIIKENFDCTQLISFHKNEIKDPACLTGWEFFISLGFRIEFDQNIRLVKKSYLGDKDNEVFVELVNQEFVGEFEDWVDLDNPPKLIDKFCFALTQLIVKNNISSIRLLISNFAEVGVSKDIVVSVNLNKIKDKMFLMSSHNFDAWGDNLIMEIIN